MSTLRPASSQASKWIAALGCAALAATVAWPAHDESTSETSILPSEHPAINYGKAPADDPAARLSQKLQSGEATLEWSEGGLGYLPSLLENLGVNSDSQVMVFSKTSFQAARISPRAPRAIYFSDDASIGYVQESDTLELAALDPKLGYMFYTFDNVKSDRPTIDRRDVCLQCHHGPATQGIPGIMVASVYPDSSGMPAARLGMPVTDHRTRFDERWGGWYVTGGHGGMLHRGNAVARDRKFPDLLETRGTQNLTDLSKKFDTAPYLEKSSDIVALLVLEHQTRTSNLITRAGWAWRLAEAEGTEEARKRAAAAIDSLVDSLLFVDEAKLFDKVAGTSTFAQTFTERGPKDSNGRSLRDFDLQSRLFRYPLSYMIYTEAFDKLPEPVLQKVNERLRAVLTGMDKSAKYARFTPELRKQIVEIVGETKNSILNP